MALGVQTMDRMGRLSCHVELGDVWTHTRRGGLLTLSIGLLIASLRDIDHLNLVVPVDN